VHLFIDSNIFLLFYQSSKDDLEELDKLKVLLRKGELKMWLPDQVREELRRKRETVIAAAIKDLKEQRLDFQFPAMSKDYAEHDELRRLQREYSRVRSQKAVTEREASLNSTALGCIPATAFQFGELDAECVQRTPGPFRMALPSLGIPPLRPGDLPHRLGQHLLLRLA
jgi:PIN domain